MHSDKLITVLDEKGGTDWIQNFLNAPFLLPPNTKFNYISENTSMLSAIITRVTGMSVIDYLYPRILEPLGIEKPFWESDGQGNNAGGWVNIGRAWRGLGFQNVLLGTETDGIQAGIPIKGTGLTASAIYASGTGTGDKESIYGIGTWGSVGHCVDINLNYVKSDMSKGDHYTTSEIENVSLVGGKLVTTYKQVDVPRDKAFVLSTGIDVAKNVRLLNDYIQTNADDENKSIATRINYKGTDLNDPGSFGLYARYFKYGSNGQIAGDDEWGSTPFGSKGWIVGVKYVPAKNVEWETLYSQQKCDYAGSNPYDRRLFRTQVDFHF